MLQRLRLLTFGSRILQSAPQPAAQRHARAAAVRRSSHTAVRAMSSEVEKSQAAARWVPIAVFLSGLLLRALNPHIGTTVT